MVLYACKHYYLSFIYCTAITNGCIPHRKRCIHVVCIPNIAVALRRMHDVGKSGWFLLSPIYNLILDCTDGNVGPNEYGHDQERRNCRTGLTRLLLIRFSKTCFFKKARCLTNGVVFELSTAIFHGMFVGGIVFHFTCKSYS